MDDAGRIRQTFVAKRMPQAPHLLLRVFVVTHDGSV